MDSVEAVRSTTKWIAASCFGLLSLLLGLVPLGTLRDSDLTDSEWYVLGGLALVALAGSGLIAAKALRVLDSTPATLRALLIQLDRTRLRKGTMHLYNELVANKYAILRGEYASMRDVWDELAAHNQDVSVPVSETFARATDCENRILDLAEHVVVHYRYDSLRRWIYAVLPAVAAAVLGIGLIAVVAPKQDSLKAVDERTVTLVPNGDTRKELSRRLGCMFPPSASVTLLAINGDYSRFRLGIAGVSDCRPEVLDLDDDSATIQADEELP